MENYRIICIAQIYNELEKGNLKRFVKYLKPLVDDIIVYDDGSTDGSYEYIQKITPYVIRGGKNDFQNEIAHKQLLLEKAKKLGAGFILWLDADEVLTQTTRDELQQLCQKMVKKNIDGLSMHEINIWRSKTWQRLDSLYNIGWFVRLWKITPQTKFSSNKKGLHQENYPPNLKKIEKTNKISVLHYGFSTEKNLAYKYLTYKFYGQRGYDMLDRLISEEKLQLKKISEKLFPEGLYIKGEPKPQKMSFMESLTFVERYKNNFLKQQKHRFKTNIKKFPLVTIITPTFNRADLLGETMESVLSQDYPNVEYIVIDDGSDDNTDNVVKEFKKKKYPGKKLVYIKQKNIGETKAVNRGLSLAKGKYIAIVNSDDPLVPGSISEIVECLEQNPKVLAVYPDWEMIDENSKAIKTVHPKDYNYLQMLKEHYCIPGPGTFFQKEAIKLTGGRSTDFKYLADFAFWLKLGMYGQIMHLPKTLATFRVHSGSQGIYAQGKAMARESVEIVQWIYKDPDVPIAAFSVRNEAYASAYYHAAKKSANIHDSLIYYFRSFKSDPKTFYTKFLYDIKKHIIH